MKITVINGTEKHGVTYRLKEIFLEEMRSGSGNSGSPEITEYYLPKDCPNFCTGCTACFLKGEQNCKDAGYIQKIEKSLREADLLVFTSPSYVFHATGAMKNMLDHFGYRWMSHRPAEEMFGKRAVIITQALGAGEKSSAKDIKVSLSWWGISFIKFCHFKLMDEILWDKMSEKKQGKMIRGVRKLALRMKKIDYTKPAHTNIVAKLKFYVVRMLQKSLGKDNPEYTDFKYWKQNGWTEKQRPWKKNSNRTLTAEENVK
ncbi:MAG: flavodoxin family protein [Treponema sp.]|nr:flavodoxin family protein [Treponema sp.]